MTPEARRRQHDDDLRWLMSSEAGRRWLWTLLDERMGTFGPSYAGESTHETAFAEGRRAVGLLVTQDLHRVAPADWVHMVEEAFSRREQDRLEAERIAKENADGDG